LQFLTGRHRSTIHKVLVCHGVSRRRRTVRPQTIRRYEWTEAPRSAPPQAAQLVARSVFEDSGDEERLDGIHERGVDGPLVGPSGLQDASACAGGVVDGLPQLWLTTAIHSQRAAPSPS
jgi:hypothetical protein